MFSRALLRPLSRAAVPMLPRARTLTTLEKVMYTASGEASGQGRNGKAHLVGDGEGFEVKLAMPKALGGAGDGNNPEQLFALGFASCFLSALNLTAGQQKIKLPSNVRCQADVHIGKPAGKEGFGLGVDLIIRSDAKSEEEKKTLKEAVEKAHQVCPYSNATRNNIQVNLKVE